MTTSKSDYLKQELSFKEREPRSTTDFTKKFIEENEFLKSKIEVLKQEKHSLLLKSDANTHMVESQNIEIEEQRKSFDFVTEANSLLVKENGQINRRLKESIEEVTVLREDNEQLVFQNQQYQKKIVDLEHQLEGYLEKDQTSLNESNRYEDLLVTLQKLKDCEKERTNLKFRVSELESELCKAKLMEEKFGASIKELQDHLEEKNQELQSYSTLLEKTKEENAELFANIEIFKLEQVDENRRGNSVFGELDDRRKEVEKEYIVLREKYRALKECNDLNQQHLKKTRGQLALAVGMTNCRESDRNYIKELETKLLESRKEIQQLTNVLSEQQKSQTEIVPLNIDSSGDHDDYAYLQILLRQSRQKNENLRAELEKLRFSNVAETNKLIDTENSLYQSKKTVDRLKGELLRTKLEVEEIKHIKDIAQSKGEVEIIPHLVKREQALCGDSVFEISDGTQNDVEERKLTNPKSIEVPKVISMNKMGSGCAQQ